MGNRAHIATGEGRPEPRRDSRHHPLLPFHLAGNCVSLAGAGPAGSEEPRMSPDAVAKRVRDLHA